MYNSPGTLKELCIDYVCNNIEKLYMTNPKSKINLQPYELEYTFNDSKAYLPMEVSEILLTSLSERNKLNDETLSLFNNNNVYLRNVILPNTKYLTSKGLNTLKEHKIKTLRAYGLQCTINELICSLGECTTQKLQSLSVPNIIFPSESSVLRYSAVSLSNFINLHSLDVSDTEFSTNDLKHIIEELPYLESLDISNTKVDTLEPLATKNKLRKLSVYNLKVAPMNFKAFEPLKSLTSLIHLDLSSEKYFQYVESFSNDTSWLKCLTDPDWLPNLVSLDISGNGNVGPKIIEDFLTTHKELKFLGLMHMDDCCLSMFTVLTHPLYNPDLVVTGAATQEQLLAGLRRYTKRPTYTRECLFHLFKCTEIYESPKIDIIMLILNVMNCFSDNVSVQMVSTVGLYNLIENGLVSKIHPDVLAKVVKATLDIMERFSNHLMLQQNTLSTLISVFKSQDFKMDKLRCLKVVLESFRTLDNLRLNYMHITFCTELVNRMTTSETSQLGCNPKYMPKLINIIKELLFTEIASRITVSILDLIWNLTDESPTTCTVFMDEGGLQLSLRLLKKYIGDSEVETKVLGLVSHIAEVPHLRTMLLNNIVVTTWRRLLRSQEFYVSYLAAVTIAHLACEPFWKTDSKNSKAVVLKELRYAVKRWVPPECEVVTYNSFMPFIGLLYATDTPQVQLWAAWAILHVCTKNANKYCAMLDKENGVIILQNVVLDNGVDSEVHELCNRILNLMNEFRNSSNPVLPMDTAL